MPRMLIDCDAYFASCEQARNPSLRGKKVVVAGDTEQRSVVAAASYEARAYGVKAGTPIQEARRLLPDGRTVHLRVRYEDFTEFARSKTMPRPVLLAEHLLEGVNYLLAKHHRHPERKIRLLGIGAANLVRARGYQLSLFPRERRALALARALDHIKEAFGQDAIGRASSLGLKGGAGPFTIVPGSGRRS